MAIFLKKESAQSRYDVCKKCDEFNSTLKLCQKCGCIMPAKVKLASATCPIDKWPIINVEEWKYQ
jgi:hypothetical protein